MSRYKILDQKGLNFLTLTIVGWIDVFTRRIYRDMIIESLAYCQANKGLKIYGYVIMSNHLHLIVSVEDGELSDVIRDFKKYSSKQILTMLQNPKESRRSWMEHLFKYYGNLNPKNKTYQVWQQDNHPIYLYSAEVIHQKLSYIHDNPVRAGWVTSPEQYLYSSASNYFLHRGLLTVDLLLLLL
jgi:putative transposase